MNMNDAQLDVLVIAAHPDDAELSVGGTLIKLALMGYKTGVADMTRGELGTRGTPEIRAEEAAQSAIVLRLTVRDNVGLSDGHVLDDHASRAAVVRVIRQYRPKIVFTHYWDDPHPDHAQTSRIVTEAAHLAGLTNYDIEINQARHRPNMVAYFLFPHKVAPSFVVDITDVAAQKLEAIKCYQSQFHNPDSNEPETMLSAESFLRRIEARQRYYGAIIDVEHGEAFYVKQALNVDDPVVLLSRTMSLYS
jgi:bacillithiol biosynthesis deacetylase BshB1